MYARRADSGLGFKVMSATTSVKRTDGLRCSLSPSGRLAGGKRWRCVRTEATTTLLCGVVALHVIYGTFYVWLSRSPSGNTLIERE